ncbi:MAG TPA: hypothetical protein VKX17_22365 [Planctomycetota bacterium]|nr:hypothetical protein [Planctomycetota bacterium]
MENFHIVLRDGTPGNWALASDVLAASTGMYKVEAAKQCRRGYGLILHAFQQAQAEAGVAALSQAGFPAKSIAASDLIQAPPALSVISVSPERDVLICHPGLNGAPLEIPQAGVRIIYAGNLVPSKQKNEKAALAELALKSSERSAVETTKAVTKGLAVGVMALSGIGVLGAMGAQADPRNVEAVHHTARAPEPCGELVCTAPLLRVRFMERKYNYQSLGARRLPAMRGNFRLVINDLLAALPHAVHAGQVKEAAGGVNLEQEKFIRDEADLNLEIMAILTREAQFGI